MIELFYFIFCLLYLFSLFYVIFKKRSVDFFTLMVFSLSYYSFPLLLEELTLVCVIENIPIHENIYLIFIFIYTVNFIFMIKTDYKDLNKIYVINHSQSIENNLLLILTILLSPFTTTVIAPPPALISAVKALASSCFFFSFS